MQQLNGGAPYKRILALDFETCWSSGDYTLSLLTTEEYIRDRRFKAWGCSYMYLDEAAPPQWVTGKELPSLFASVDWRTTAGLAHNAQFDFGILAWIYGHHPCFIFDTLSMARALYGVEVGNSAKKLAERFGLPPKGRAVHSTDGIMDALPPHIEEELARYCEHDTALCTAFYDRMIPQYPTKELRLIDMTLKMFTNPVLKLDKPLLVDAIHEERVKREGLLSKLKVSEQELASNDKFAVVLQSMGVKPPKKLSLTTGKEAFAFSKKDAGFQALVNHVREDVALLCEARLAVKSTLERTRSQRFLDIAKRGTLPVPLRYYAAHTGRWGGDGQINLQNLKRGSTLRRAIQAPDGYVLIAADLSQIEPRILAWLSDYTALLRVFSKGGDPYATFGAQMFGVPGMTKDSHPDLRQSAKSALLGAGYGLGWASFAGQLMTGFLGAPPVLYGIGFAKQLGLRAVNVERFVADEENNKKMMEIPRVCTNDELAVHCAVTKVIIDRYRAAANPVVKFWTLCNDYIGRCLASQTLKLQLGGGQVIQHKGVLTFTQEQIVLPSGLSLRYPDLASRSDEKGRLQWTYDAGKRRSKLYGGKLTENIVQAVARVVMTDGMLRCAKRYPCVLTVHDEAVYLVPEVEQEEAKTWIREQTVKEPKYMPGLPLDVTMGVGKRYGDAK